MSTQPAGKGRRSATTRDASCEREYNAAPARVRRGRRDLAVGSIRALAIHDRPREKLEAAGPAALGDNELLAVLIGHGSAGRDALDVANGLLARVGGVRGLGRIPRVRLLRQAGVGPAQASRIQAAIEIGRRTLTHPLEPRPRFASPRALASFLMPRFSGQPVEQFGVVLLDTRHRLMAIRVISIGSVDQSAAQPRDVYREAVMAGAPAIVVFHNHPSGDPMPSRDDFELTARLKSAGHLMGIALVDHIVLADARYYSMQERGLL
jgi:DNA repair protein RadC